MLRLIHFIVLLCTASFSFAQNWDINTLRSINQSSSQSKTNFFDGVGKMSYVVDIGTPTTMLLIGLSKKDRTLSSKALAGFAAYGQNAIITSILKKTINRKRPFITYTDIIQRQPATTESMPSGHTSSAFTTATALTISYPKWYVAVPAYTFAGLVGYSRMYHGVHYPSDVLAGAAVGTGSALLAHYLRKRIVSKAHKKGKFTSITL